MKKHSKVMRNLAKHVGLLSFFMFSFSALALSSEQSIFPVTMNQSDAYLLSKGEVLQKLQLEKIKIRTRSLEKESLTKAFEERITFLMQRAESAWGAKDYASAKKIIREILILNPRHKKALAMLVPIAREKSGKISESSFALFKEEGEIPYLANAEYKRIVAFFMRRGEQLLMKKRYDEAVEEFEQVFLLDPLSEEASRKIDEAKKLFLREEKKQWKHKAVQYDRDFSDQLAYSFDTVGRLMREKNFMEAKVVLNRMAFLDPEDKRIRKLMEKIQKQEKQLSSRTNR